MKFFFNRKIKNLKERNKNIDLFYKFVLMIYRIIFKMLRFIAFIVLSIFATYMESSIDINRKRSKSKQIPVPITNQLPA